MITLTVFQQGEASYPSGISKSFNPTQILKMVATSFGADTSCCLFLYEQQQVVVAQSVNQVSNLMIHAGYPCLGIGEAAEGGVTLPFNVIFLTQAIQYLESIDGYPAATYGIPSEYKATSTAFGQSSTVPFQRCAQALQASNFIRKDRVLSDGTTNPIYINPNALSTITGDSYVFPSGKIIETSTATYVHYRATKSSASIDGAVDVLTSITFTGIGAVASGETFDDLDTSTSALIAALGAVGVYVELVTANVTNGVSFIMDIYSPTAIPTKITTVVNGVSSDTSFVVV